MSAYSSSLLVTTDAQGTVIIRLGFEEGKKGGYVEAQWMEGKRKEEEVISIRWWCERERKKERKKRRQEREKKRAEITLHTKKKPSKYDICDPWQ